MSCSGIAAEPVPTVTDKPEPPGIGTDTKPPVPLFTGVSVKLVPGIAICACATETLSKQLSKRTTRYFTG